MARRLTSYQMSQDSPQTGSLYFLLGSLLSRHSTTWSGVRGCASQGQQKRSVGLRKLPRLLLSAVVLAGPLHAQNPLEGPALELGAGTGASCPDPEQLSDTRPPSDGGPTRVGAAMFVNDITGLDDADQSFTTDVYFILQWTDPRLADPGRGSALALCELPFDRLWNPSLQFDLVRGIDRYYQDLVSLDAEGTITHAQRLYMQIAAPMDLRDFPFDRHTLVVSASPVYLSTNEMVLEVIEGFVGREPSMSLNGWQVGEVSAEVAAEFRERLGIELSFFRGFIQIRRESAFYFWKSFLPLTLIVFMSWAVFWIDPSQIGPQIGISATSMLTLIAYLFALAGILPRISYLTRADQFVLSAATLIFLALVESLTASFLARQGKTDTANRLDWWSRRVFPSAFAAIALFVFL